MWNQLEDALVAELEFKNFVDAFAFMTDVAALAEQHQHHPEWSNVYNRVTIRLTTHDAGNQLTDKDRNLAKAIQALASASLVQATG
ncbi:MAG: pterin-4-alpha-carbinolamine dehydratase [Gammaproteobacteria bacterium]|jgi:4a-hydroxytetrahydrobiopterin dehydratase|nr:pterin-4-alpha-carbinolamine dehydratase [Gammaproteobacteria bacterium]MBT5155795.1 pterin-4-alpha-carbinolamine dehydratase [Gammaproteobacteria bacterium]MBT5683375.1 pterin-4-alpha-carbinolamine dehydratase [Gammaproteobacteria bacterium]MBT5725699.1 pterin-4-alpha-carbinolamine dehydratase [Gammaproteobacteria bacterium]MBT6586398.1 pterin-4-alpha-carbinolamine dehydratase [Gammaproteobacteria bacterium]